MAWTTHTADCPHCNKEITLDVERWSTDGVCPECKQPIDIEYDCILMDDYEEWDIWAFHKPGEGTGF